MKPNFAWQDEYLSKWFIGHDGYFDKEFGEFVNKHRAIP